MSDDTILGAIELLRWPVAVIVIAIATVCILRGAIDRFLQGPVDRFLNERTKKVTAGKDWFMLEKSDEHGFWPTITEYSEDVEQLKTATGGPGAIDVPPAPATRHPRGTTRRCLRGCSPPTPSVPSPSWTQCASGTHARPHEGPQPPAHIGPTRQPGWKPDRDFSGKLSGNRVGTRTTSSRT